MNHHPMGQNEPIEQLGELVPRSFESRVDGVRVNVMAGHFPPPTQAPELLSPKHSHAWFELFLMTSGTLTCRFENSSFQITAGEMLLIRPGLPHYTVPEPEDAGRIVLNLDFEVLPEASGEVADLFGSVLKIEDYRVFRPGPDCERMAELLSRALESRDVQLSGPYTYALLLLVARAISDDRHDRKKKMKEMLSDSRIGRLYQLDQIFRYYYMCNLTLSDTAELLHLSPRQLARVIRRQYGCSYLEKMTAMRMEAASRLLTTTDEPIAKVAEEVGYASLSCFYSAFRAAFGVLPRAYRKEKR